MEDIKFRYWDKKEKYMMNVDSIFFAAGGTHVDGPGIAGGWSTVNEKFKGKLEENIVLMQYIGIPDKNGKDMYKDDIVRIKLNKGTYFLAVVVWYKLGWKLKSIEGQGGEGNWSYQYFEDPKDREVVGNIHENPELLVQR